MMITEIIYDLFKTIVFPIDEVMILICQLKMTFINLLFFILILVSQMKEGQCLVIFLVLKM